MIGHNTVIAAMWYVVVFSLLRLKDIATWSQLLVWESETVEWPHVVRFISPPLTICLYCTASQLSGQYNRVRTSVCVCVCGLTRNTHDSPCCFFTTSVYAGALCLLLGVVTAGGGDDYRCFKTRFKCSNKGWERKKDGWNHAALGGSVRYGMSEFAWGAVCGAAPCWE